MNITVIGCGRWGSLITWYLDRTGHQVTLYGRPESARMQRFLTDRSNDLLTLPESVALSTDLACVQDAEVIIISIGSQSLRGLMEELRPMALRDKTFVLCMKGLEIGTGERLSQVAREYLDSSNAIAVWLGPGHVQEFYRGVPNCMVIDSADAALREAFRRAACPHAPAEPLDWMETTCPARWRTDEGEIEYDWDDDFGAEPLKR